MHDAAAAASVAAVEAAASAATGAARRQQQPPAAAGSSRQQRLRPGGEGNLDSSAIEGVQERRPTASAVAEAKTLHCRMRWGGAAHWAKRAVVPPETISTANTYGVPPETISTANTYVTLYMTKGGNENAAADV